MFILKTGLTLLKHRTHGPSLNNFYIRMWSMELINDISIRLFMGSNFNILFSQKKFTKDPGKLVKKDGTVVRLKTAPKQMISLIEGSHETVMTLDEAKTIARRHRLNLVKIKTLHSGTRECYEMVKDHELASNNKEDQKSKRSKIMIFPGSISDHDMIYRVNSIVDLIKKKRSVKMIVKIELNDKSDFLIKKTKETLDKEGLHYGLSFISQNEQVKHYFIVPQDAPNKTDKRNNTNRKEDETNQIMENDNAS